MIVTARMNHMVSPHSTQPFRLMSGSADFTGGDFIVRLTTEPPTPLDFGIVSLAEYDKLPSSAAVKSWAKTCSVTDWIDVPAPGPWLFIVSNPSDRHVTVSGRFGNTACQ